MSKLTDFFNINKKMINADEIEENILRVIDKNKIYYILAHKYHEVCIGKYVDNEYQFMGNKDLDIDNIIEIRIFNSDMEIHIVKVDENKFVFRSITDNREIDDANDVTYFDEKYLLFGTKAIIKSNWIELKDGRGINIKIPYDDSFKSIDYNDPKIFLKVRNYAEFDEKGLMDFKDSRLLGFTIKKKGREVI